MAEAPDGQARSAPRATALLLQLRPTASSAEVRTRDPDSSDAGGTRHAAADHPGHLHVPAETDFVAERRAGVRQLAQGGSCRCHPNACSGVTTLDGGSTCRPASSQRGISSDTSDEPSTASLQCGSYGDEQQKVFHATTPVSGNARCDASRRPPTCNGSRRYTELCRISFELGDIYYGRGTTVCSEGRRSSNGMRRRVRAERARTNDLEAEQRTVHTNLTVSIIPLPAEVARSHWWVPPGGGG